MGLGSGVMPVTLRVKLCIITPFDILWVYTPVAAVSVNIKWEPCGVHWRICMARLWNKPIKYYNGIYNIKDSWYMHLICFVNIGLEEFIFRQEKIDIKTLKGMVFHNVWERLRSASGSLYETGKGWETSGVEAGNKPVRTEPLSGSN